MLSSWIWGTVHSKVVSQGVAGKEARWGQKHGMGRQYLGSQGYRQGIVRKEVILGGKPRWEVRSHQDTSSRRQRPECGVRSELAGSLLKVMETVPARIPVLVFGF